MIAKETARTLKKKKREITPVAGIVNKCVLLFFLFFLRLSGETLITVTHEVEKKKAEYDSSVCNSVVFASPSAWKEREREAERVALLLHPTLRFFFLLQYLKRDELKKKWERSPYRKKKTITKTKEI